MLLKKTSNIVRNSIRRINKNLPIASKLTLWYTSFIAFITIVMLMFSMVLTVYIVKNSSESRLVKKVNYTADNMDKFEASDDGFFFSVIEKGKIIRGAYPKNFSGEVEVSQNKVSSITNSNKNFMYYDIKLNKDKYLRGIIPITEFMYTIKKLSIILLVAAPVMLLIICAVGYSITKKAFLPVKRLSQTAKNIEMSRDFSRRLYLSDVNDEIHEMTLVLNSMLDSLEQAHNKEKQFSNDVSHELRTPISVILSESEYGMKYVEDKEARETFEVINRQSLKMSQMIKSIMELSRMDKIENIEKEEIDISASLNRILPDWEILCKNKNIVLKSEIEDNIRVDTNYILFERLVDNLLSNALKFTKDCIEVRLKSDDEKIYFSVKDNGCGMNKDEIENIWNRFYQSNKSRNKGANSGIGLGLSFVDKIVSINKWQIKVESVVNEYSEFKVIIDK